MAIDKGGQCAGVLAKGSDLAGDFLPDFGSRQRPQKPALGYLGDFRKAPRRGDAGHWPERLTQCEVKVKADVGFISIKPQLLGGRRP